MILMDMRMPEMDGLAATRAIRAKGGALASVPIIAFTANAFADDQAACRDAGMNGYIAKPVRKNVLIDAILRALPPVLPSASAQRPTGAPVRLATPAANREPQHPPTGEPAAAAGKPTAEGGARLYVGKKAFDNLVAEIGEDAARDVLAVFIRDTEARLRLFDTLSVTRDRRKIEREAHSLKSAAGTFGLETLANLARDLERRAPELSEPDYVALIRDIQSSYAKAKRAPVGDDRLVECAA